MDFPTVVDSQYAEISQGYPHLKSSDANTPTFGGRLTLFWILSRSPALLHKSPACYVHYKYWILIRSTFSGAFLHVFSHWQRLFLASKRWFRILIVRTSCKTSYNVLSHSYWGLGQFFFWGGGGFVEIPRGGGVVKKDSLRILGLQRLASLQVSNL